MLLSSSLLIILAGPAAVQDCIALVGPHRRLTLPLVAAERRFAARAADDLRSAFLDVLADDSFMFRPTIVEGRSYWHNTDPGPVRLSWEPAHASVSADGDFGYTFGPWTLSDGRGIAYGSYFSIWQREGEDDDSPWRLLADHGVSHAQQAMPRFTRCKAPGRPAAITRNGHADRMERLKQAEEVLGDDSYIPSAWLLSDGQPPRQARGLCRQPTQRTRISRGGDMALTAGAQSERSSFLRVWRYDHEHGWRIEVELCRGGGSG